MIKQVIIFIISSFNAERSCLIGYSKRLSIRYFNTDSDDSRMFENLIKKEKAFL